MFVRVWRYASACCFVLAISGCGEIEPPVATGTVPFEGVVMLDDTPLENATVSFVPTGETQALDAGAQTDAEGKFQLRSDRGRVEGAMPGEYKVVISRLVRPDGSIAIATDDKSPMQLAVEENAKESIPAKYSDVLRTTLKGMVPATGGTQTFSLKSK